MGQTVIYILSLSSFYLINENLTKSTHLKLFRKSLAFLFYSQGTLLTRQVLKSLEIINHK